MDGELGALTISAEDSAVAFEPDESIGGRVGARPRRAGPPRAGVRFRGGDASRRRRVVGRGARRARDERRAREATHRRAPRAPDAIPAASSAWSFAASSTFTGTFMTKRFTSLHPRCSSHWKVCSQKRDQLVGHRARQGVPLEPRRARSTQDGTPRSPHLGGYGGGRPFLLECVRHDRRSK